MNIFNFRSWLVGCALVIFASHVVAQTEIYFIHNDHLGTPQVMTDDEQNIVWKGEYGPFGELVSEAGTLDQSIRFPGQYEDPETGYYYNYYRDYDPTLGRYIQSDPIGLRGGMNTYGYVFQNPVRYVDPFGLEVSLQTHPVALGFDHAKVTAIPQNQSRWASDPRFGRLPNGDAYVTFGAGPRWGAFPTLENGLNRPRDADLSHNTSSTSVFNGYCPSPEAEDQAIQDLLDAHSQYTNDLDYVFFPQSWAPSGYNSNSYVGGLLNATGLSASPPPGIITPGLNRPVPPGNFGLSP